MITVEYPLTLPSLANARFCWQSKAALVKRQRNTTWFALHGNYLAHQLENACKIPIGSDRKLVVTMTRCAPRAIRDEHDNLRSCLKHVVDEIAAYFHVDDSDARIEWRYAQEKAATSSVRLCFVVEKKSPESKMTPEKLWRFISPEPNTGCWLWAGTLNDDGRGQISVDGRTRKAARVCWEAFNGQIPDGVCVCHRCDNPTCVNPSHLFLGSVADNNADKLNKGRQSRGVDHGLAKLNPEKVTAARRMYANGDDLRSIARHFSVTQGAIHGAIHGHTWGHVVDGIEIVPHKTGRPPGRSSARRRGAVSSTIRNREAK